ncbi:hypothetical protein RDWZM_006524 [Blomia tropicalis]|uniref:Ubiquitin carboxyl-terminal hydrolase n=1 Tax=Blomia tropicalis TaxID=40697 RepID=A0A9Q0MAM6_BLOTA|nr:hypothetical protein RDWZM_006524 [Blomia tropicalis]
MEEGEERRDSAEDVWDFDTDDRNRSTLLPINGKHSYSELFSKWCRSSSSSSTNDVIDTDRIEMESNEMKQKQQNNDEQHKQMANQHEVMEEFNDTELLKHLEQKQSIFTNSRYVEKSHRRYCGLAANSGNNMDCWNSILQLFYTTTPIRQYFIKRQMNGPLHESIGRLLSEMEQSASSLSRRSRKMCVNQTQLIKTSQERVQTNESNSEIQTFLISMLDDLHKEVKQKSVPKTIMKEATNSSEAWFNHCQTYCESFLSQTFKCQLEQVKTCRICRKESKWWDCGWIWQLEVPPNDVSKIYSLNDLINQFQSEKLIDSTCKNCSRNDRLPCFERYSISRTSPYIIIHLSRSTQEHNQEQEILIPFQIELNSRCYQLQSSIVRNNGKYSILIHESTNQWVSIEDDQIEKCIQNTQAQVILIKCAQLLLYQINLQQQQQSNLKKKEVKKFNRELYEFCGLYNLGNTCYLNASIQLLYGMTKIRSYLIEQGPKYGTLHSSLSKLFLRMESESDRVVIDHNRSVAIKPDEFVRTFRSIRAEFNQTIMFDAQEFLSILIESLYHEAHQSINATITADEMHSNDEGGREVQDNHCRFIDQIYLSQLLMGQLEVATQCSKCGLTNRTWNCFWQLQMQLEIENQIITNESELTSTSMMGNLNASTTPSSTPEKVISIRECIQDYSTSEVLKDQPKCSKCDSTESIRRSNVLRIPHYLIINVSRFTNDHHKIQFPIVIDERLVVGQQQFQLSSILIHQGTTLQQGHYITFHREKGNHWTRLDDDQVTKKIGMETILFQIQISAYICVYKAIPNTEQCSAPNKQQKTKN